METTTQTNPATTDALDLTSGQFTTTPEGYIVDENGEVVGHAEVKQEFRVTDQASAEWVMEKLAIAQSEVLALEVRRKALLENIDREIARKSSRAAFFLRRFGADLEEFARNALAGKKSRSLYLLNGTISFRSSKGGLVVRDPSLAMEWAKEFYPDALSVKTSFVISGIDDETKSKLVEAIKRRNDGTATREDAEDSEIDAAALAAFDFAAPSESVTIKTGIPTKLENLEN